MNMIGTQAAGLNKLFEGLTHPPVAHDAEMLRNQHIIDTLRVIRPHMTKLGDLPDVPQMIVDGQYKAKRLSRLDELVSIADFIGNASLLECKHIINELIDRTSTITGCATELENAACALSRSIEIDGDVNGDAADSLRAYMEGRDEL